MAKRVVVEMWECELCGQQYQHERSANACSRCQPQTEKVKRGQCRGCDDDFYNRLPHTGCWLLKDMHLTQRKEVPVTARPPWNQKPDVIPNCYKRRGYVYVDPDVTC